MASGTLLSDFDPFNLCRQTDVFVDTVNLLLSQIPDGDG